MSTATFDFLFLDPEAGGDYDESPETLDQMEESQGGRSAVIARASYSRWRGGGTLLLPDNDKNDPSDFWTFWDARSGRVDTFLFKAKAAYWHISTAEALGTASGGGGETFALDYKHVDSSTLRVFVGTAEQVLTTDYAFSGNNSAPLITTTASFDTGTVTAYYEFYIPVRFAMNAPRPRIVKYPENSYGQQETVAIGVQMVEDLPGARFA